MGDVLQYSQTRSSLVTLGFRQLIIKMTGELGAMEALAWSEPKINQLSKT